MTQAQLDLPNQLEQTTTDLITQTLFNNSPVPFFEALAQDHPNAISEQFEHNNVSPKAPTPPEILFVYLEKHHSRRNRSTK